MDAPRQPSPAATAPSAVRSVPRWVLLLLAVVVGLALAVGVDVVRSGGVRPWLARHGLGALWTVTYQAQGERFDPGGRSLYLDCRGEGSPTVVLVAGMGVAADTWAAVLPDLAVTTRTCAYDRPGIGRSDPGTTADHAAAAADLRALLTAAGEGGPFVLVGHSLGADMARVMASEDRDRVVGLALVDGFEPDLFEADVMPLLGALADEYRAHYDALWDLVARTEGLDRERSSAQLAAVDVRGLPIEVIRPARGEPRLDQATNEAIRAAQLAGYEALSPGKVRYTTAWASGHVVQVDQPDLVIDAIRRLVETARSAAASP